MDTITINYSVKQDYHTQRNNKRIPHGSCNTTSKAMWYRYNDIYPEIPEGMQDEDYYTKILSTKEAFDYMNENYPWAREDYRPQEIHAMLNGWLDDKVLGKRVSEFHNKYPIRSHIWRLLQSEALIWSGLFNRSLHHIVTGVGFITKQTDIEQIEDPKDIDLDQITHMILDDPYGNYKTDYQDHHGNDIEMPWEIWLEFMKPLDDMQNKRAHVLIK